MEPKRFDEWVALGQERTSCGDFAGAIEALSAANRARPSARLERQLLELRRRGFLISHRPQTEPAQAPVSRTSAVPIDPAVGLPVIETPVTAETVRSTIESHGSLIVRRFIESAQAAALRQIVETALAARDGRKLRWLLGGRSTWYHEFDAGHVMAAGRKFTSTDGMLAVDSPRGMFQLLEVFRERRIERLAEEILSGPPVLAAEKSVFRRITPAPFGSWHQDGAFLGAHSRALDTWIALTPCGRTAPALAILPCRVDRILSTGAYFAWDLSEDVMRQEYPGIEPVFPELEPGDAILFDQLCVHRTGHRAGMTESRMAIECWLFSASTLPDGYTGLLL